MTNEYRLLITAGTLTISTNSRIDGNIALLFRRLRAHLGRAEHDFRADDRGDSRRFPALVPVATSATIKSFDEDAGGGVDVTGRRTAAVQEFVHTLLGLDRDSIRVIGEERAPVAIPEAAAFRLAPTSHPIEDDLRGPVLTRALRELAPERSKHPVLAAKMLFTLSELLAKRPLSTEELVERVRASVAERRDVPGPALRHEVELALRVGAALATQSEIDGTEGEGAALRLRVHRFLRGGWRFHRCVDPACGKLYAKGEERCVCGRVTAPLLLCRSCGADALHFTLPEAPPSGDEPATVELRAFAPGGAEGVLYDSKRHEIAEEEDDDPGEEITTGRRARRGRKAAREMKGQPVREGSFDPAECRFSSDPKTFSVPGILAPARTRCLVCGGTAGSRPVLTGVALGTSAALRVVTEATIESIAREHRRLSFDAKKERALVFADSRQDAAHQARFITFAGRYDRMRRRVVEVLDQGPSSLEKVLVGLLAAAFEHRDNPHLSTAHAKKLQYVSTEARARALAWEEAPLLDDLAVSSSYRATVFNLGLVGIRYGRLDAYVDGEGGELAAQLGLTKPQLWHLARSVLDEMRSRGAVSRPLLQFHPQSAQCPEEVRVHAEWERKRRRPVGYAATTDGRPVSALAAEEVPGGIELTNGWRRTNRGRPPRMQRLVEHLVGVMGRKTVADADLVTLLEFLRAGDLIVPAKLWGASKSRLLFQVNADVLELELVDPAARRRCTVCNVRAPWATIGAPCPACHGTLRLWPASEVEENRYVRRIREASVPLVAAEHTAQVTSDERYELETRFKDDADPLNVLACSPTLEMGIDVGGLDAVLMRNVPPRPDNYAQRGGRAGRRSRIGLVIGYARSTPHDQYFYDRPAEMIAGEVAAPPIGLGNRDVVVRHLTAIAMGAAEPGLAGRMAEYVTLQGQVMEEPVRDLVAGFEAQIESAADLALHAFGADVLEPAGLRGRDDLVRVLRDQVPRIGDVFERTALQIQELRKKVQDWADLGVGGWNAMHAMNLARRILGLPDERQPGAQREADDRSGGHPMRRFAEFGILPGYEFPSEPATLRLLQDAHEEDVISVARRFGLSQYQPEAIAHARGHRWRIVGLDPASPWNPKSDAPQWPYRICAGCDLRYHAQGRGCPRCGSTQAGGRALAGHEFGGFLAVRDDSSVLEEEERISRNGAVDCYPQWDGDVVARHELPTGFRTELRDGENVRWVNEGRRVRKDDDDKFQLHDRARGFLLCPTCGRVLEAPEDDPKAPPKKRNQAGGPDPFGHAKGCALAGQPPRPLAITTAARASTLRILVTVPMGLDDETFLRWGLTLGYALRTGMRQLYMLDGTEIDFELEGPWLARAGDRSARLAALTFVDGAVGGSGFLTRAAADLHLVAARALDHLVHEGCDRACYRCLKAYQNQRHHAYLSWPHVHSDLLALAEEQPRALPPKLGDVFRAKPWLDAYDAGVGSPLELRVLRALEKKGVAVEKQYPIRGDHGAVLTIADFAVPGERIAIYVDSAAFHNGTNLRRDRFIRKRLREADPPWRVVELTARDVAGTLPPLEQLFGPFEAVRHEVADELPPPSAPIPAASRPNEDWLPGYQILGTIGGGGMAECFRAKSSDGEVVFVKRARVGTNDEAAIHRENDVYDRLYRSGCKLSLVAKDFVRGDTFVALVTELADGGDLDAHVKGKGGKLPVAEVVTVGLDVAKALLEVHEVGVVHRDLKPQNVLRVGEVWKLADFGIAKNLHRAAPGVTFQGAGTAGYAAPEQMDDDAPAVARPSADVYSFGKVLTFLVTGGTDVDKVPTALPELRRLVRRCCTYAAEARPGMGDVVEQLQRLLPEEDWLSGMYERVSRGDTDGAIDLLFAQVESMLANGAFPACDAELRKIDLTQLDTTLVVALLTITLAGKDRLPYRVTLLDQARKRLLELAPDRVDRLLAGLE